MDGATRELLERIDKTPQPRPQREHRGVYPNGVAYVCFEEGTALLNRVKMLIPPLEEALQIPFHWMDEGAQDAYYLTDLGFGQPGPGVMIVFIFSAYGSLFTAEPNYEVVPDGAVFDQRVAIAIEIIQSHGYIYISEYDLLELYSGDNPQFKNKTWGDRFFGYI
jgi:hypothetical protein